MRFASCPLFQNRPVTALAFRAFEECETFTDEAANSSVAYLLSASKQYAVACPSEELEAAQSIAWAAIILYPVGVIVLCASLLFACRSTLLHSSHSLTPFARSISFLHSSLAPEFFFFDLLEMAKKLLLIGRL